MASLLLENTYICTQIHVHVNMFLCICTYTPTYMYTLTHVLTHACMCALVYTHAHSCIHMMSYFWAAGKLWSLHSWGPVISGRVGGWWEGKEGKEVRGACLRAGVSHVWSPSVCSPLPGCDCSVPNVGSTCSQHRGVKGVRSYLSHSISPMSWF